jgi:hypothetical protein
MHTCVHMSSICDQDTTTKSKKEKNLKCTRPRAPTIVTHAYTHRNTALLKYMYKRDTFYDLILYGRLNSHLLTSILKTTPRHESTVQMNVYALFASFIPIRLRAFWRDFSAIMAPQRPLELMLECCIVLADTMSSGPCTAAATASIHHCFPLTECAQARLLARAICS